MLARVNSGAVYGVHASDETGVWVQYKVDNAVSDWMEIAGGESIHGIGVRGNVHSLSGCYENLVPPKGLVFKLAGKTDGP